MLIFQILRERNCISRKLFFAFLQPSKKLIEKFLKRAINMKEIQDKKSDIFVVVLLILSNQKRFTSKV